MNERPVVPRASKLSTTATSFAHGCSRTNAAAPRSPASSPSVNSAMTSCAQRLLARAQSAERLEHRGGSGAVVGGRRTGFDAVVVRHDEHRLGALLASRKPGDDVLNAPRFAIARADRRRVSGSAAGVRVRRAARRCSRARDRDPAVPIACGRCAICSTCRIARSAENTVSGAVAGTGRGGRTVRRIENAQRARSPSATPIRFSIQAL